MENGNRNMKEVLLINISNEKLHQLEFVKPIEDILRKNKITFKTAHYSKLKNIEKYSKIIICGTSLKDNQYQEFDFDWIKGFKGKILGICAGMQIIGLVFGGKIKKKTEIGYFKENFKKEFLGLNGGIEVYHLHNNYVSLPKDFEEFSDSKIPQAIKHDKKEIYGILSHPEVRNKGVFLNFLRV